MTYQKSSPQLTWALRAFAACNVFMGVGFIIWACVLQFPVETALPIGMVVLGAFALLEALLGFVMSVLGRRNCFSIYLLLGGLITLGQLALIITLFTNLDGAVNNLVEYDLKNNDRRRLMMYEPVDMYQPIEFTGRKLLKKAKPPPPMEGFDVPSAPEEDSSSKNDKPPKEGKPPKENESPPTEEVFEPSPPNEEFIDVSPPPKKDDNPPPKASGSRKYQQAYDSYENHLEIGRYVFLIGVLVQIIALMVTIVMRIKHPYVDDFDDYDSQAQTAQSAMAQIQMENLKHSVSRSNKSNAGDNNFYTSSNKMYKSVTKKMSAKYGEFTQDAAFQQKWWQKKNPFG